MRYESGSASAGMLYALAAYGIWGAAPVFWKAVEALPASELLGQRIVWSCAVGIVLVSATTALGVRGGHRRRGSASGPGSCGSPRIRRSRWTRTAWSVPCGRRFFDFDCVGPLFRA